MRLKRFQIECSLLIFISTVSLAQQQPADEIRKSIFFEGGSYDIDLFQQQDLLHWLDSIPNLERFEVHLISHTDPIGGKRYNVWLSKMRSESVEQLILQRNVSQQKISRKDWGLENAVYSNQTYRGMQMNRRVDVILYPIVF
jgi:outer membrane protein OmpA-like peptidoglycan-associated protein